MILRSLTVNIGMMTFGKLRLMSIVLLTLVSPALAKAGKAEVSAVLDKSALIAGADATMAVIVDIPKGLHGQSHTPTKDFYIPLEVKVKAPPGVEALPAIYPPGKLETYPALGELSVYTGKTIIFVPLRVKADAPAGDVKIEGTVQNQLCDDRQCFQPEDTPFAVTTKIVAAGTAVQARNLQTFIGFSPSNVLPTTGPSAALSRGAAGGKQPWSIWTAFGVALLAGLLFNVMPCVLPVLPLKAAAFHRAAEHHRSRSLLLGFAFSLGIISVFAVLAVLVLVLRVISWGSLFSNPIFIWGIVILLLFCAAGMFGAFTLTLPTTLYNVDPRQDTVGGNIVFGAFTAILATPCTAPLLPPLLLWASAQPGYIGVPAMLMVGVGMALPYLILSATPELAAKFPRTGPWAELFKQMMGFMLLAAAAYFGAGRVIHGPGFWWVIVAVIAVAAFYLIARTVQLTPNARPVAIASAIAVAMLGGSLWWTAKITGLAQGGANDPTHAFIQYSDDTFKQLRDSGKPVLVKFTANWCATCQVIEGTVFRDPNVWAALKLHGVTPIKVDLTDRNAPGTDLLLKLNPAGGIPLTAIFVPGKPDPIVIASVYTSEELLKELNTINVPTQTAAK